jgi:uncharacterized protein (DUF1330 family)
MSEVLVIVEVVRIRDAQAFDEYRAQARAQGAARGVAVLARGGSTFEGDPPYADIMVQRWPSEQAFLNWQDSEEYKPLRAIRQKAADIRIAIAPIV